MSKNILVVTGSPRKGGNSEMLADSFIKGAVQAGHTVNKYEAAFHKIDGCRACDTCWSQGVPCSHKDDFNEFAPLLQQADTLVVATPLYFYSFPAQLKAALDKMYSHAVPACPVKLKIRESAMLICGEDDEPTFEGAVGSFNQVSNFCKWDNKGVLVVPGVYAKGDILKTGALEKAEKMGRSM